MPLVTEPKQGWKRPFGKDDERYRGIKETSHVKKKQSDPWSRVNRGRQHARGEFDTISYGRVV